MALKVKVTPQVKVTCKQILPKLNIESIDKNTLNNLKKSITKYYLTVEVIDNYEGEIDDDGYAVDTNDYNTWRRNHPNKISKKSISNIIKSIKNNSLVNWMFDGYISGIGYTSSSIFNSNGFYIELLSIMLGERQKVNMLTDLVKIRYSETDGLAVIFLSGEFESK